ncbi:hypothetical protein BK727_13110 [Bacillus thuringiensis serovar roskildiensis]|uniref:Sporulation protein n=1 Tax=Bacillus thuringiensis serovar sooncheon TaxID=180891 RepID=A0A9Q5SHD1_BACTU|nr:hypothetical protein BK707_11415 [Bacillus thuringiensis serovar coreanensis]OTX42263.1 hypothetical protein BK724_26095 [Bacillus thuringiensis serovar sooncheon]OTX60274.1 hypothetical protein BK725_00985 [Bacillus thuringiensis serovar guiyangiensis]OTX69140.1 hypothetical protein BK727_13110 [Bacillus thuringiensis serovar roskildiensis]
MLFLSVVIMMMLFMYQVWDNLFHKDAETKRIEREREERRIERQEMIKEYEKKGLYK